MFDAEAIADEFCELVRIDSLSGQELKLAMLLIERLRDIGLAVHFDEAGKPIDGQVGNLWATIPASAEGLPAIMLNAHMDTVKPGSGIQPVREGDIISSAGDTILGADDKAGLAIILAVARKLIKENPSHGDIHIVFTIAEETGLTGARNMDYESFHADYALVLDGGQDFAVYTAAPSAVRITYTITGEAAHSGVCPEKGISAIQAAAIAIADMELGRIDERTTANVGIISGGEARNIIPPSCTVQAEARSHDADKLSAQVAHMRSCMEAACQEVGALLQVEEPHSYHAFDLPDDHPLVAVALEVAADLGHKAETLRGGGGSDANVFNERGIPAIIMPTGAATAHTLDETLDVPKMAASAEYLYEVIVRLQQ
jgi:tripeptide aminopeptidase